MSETRVGGIVIIKGVEYTVTRIGEAGEGKFFGKRIVDLSRLTDGKAFFCSAKNGHVAWNAKVIERR